MDKIYEQSLYCEHLFEEMSLIVKLLKVIKFQVVKKELCFEMTSR